MNRNTYFALRLLSFHVYTKHMRVCVCVCVCVCVHAVDLNPALRCCLFRLRYKFHMAGVGISPNRNARPNLASFPTCSSLGRSSKFNLQPEITLTLLYYYHPLSLSPTTGKSPTFLHLSIYPTSDNARETIIKATEVGFYVQPSKDCEGT